MYMMDCGVACNIKNSYLCCTGNGTTEGEAKKEPPTLTDEELDAMEHSEFYAKLVEQGFKKV